MNVEIGTEAAQFPEKEYINAIFVVVCGKSAMVIFFSILWNFKLNLQKIENGTDSV